MSQTVKWIVSGIVTLGALALIGYAVKITRSATPLWALILVAWMINDYLVSGSNSNSEDSGEQNNQQEKPKSNGSPAA